MKPGITFIVTAEVLGGGELYLVRFAQALKEHASVRIAGRSGTPILSEASKRGLETENLDLGRKLGGSTALYDSLRYWTAKRRLRSFVERSPDRLFVFQYKWEQLLWGGDYACERVILWEHGPISSKVLKLSFSRNRLREAYARASVVFAMNEEARKSIQGLCGREAELLPAGVDLAACAAAMDRRTETRSKLKLSPGAPVLSFVGRTTEDKGILHAVRALADAPSSAILVVCGDGDAQQAAKRLAESLQITERVRWLGWRDDTLDVLAAADVTLLLSISEGRPLVALESLAVGTPIVGLRTTPAFSAMADTAGVYLAGDLTSSAIAAAVDSALQDDRPIPSGSDWNDSVHEFVMAVESLDSSRVDV